MLSVELKNLAMAFVSVALYVFFLLVIFLAMEPFVLQPHAGEMRYVGRGEAKENKKLFPCYFHLCVAKGTRATDGWSVVSSLKCTSCTEDLGPNRHVVDAWINDSRERPTRKINQIQGEVAKTADKHVFWQGSVGFVFSQPVDFNTADLPGKQMHPVLKLGDSLATLLQGKSGAWVPADSGQTEPGTFSRPWCTGYLLRVPALVAENPLKLVTPFAFCQKLRVEPLAMEDPSRQENALAVVAATSSGSGRFASRQDYYDRGANWGDPRSERSPLQDILFADMAYVMQNFSETETILSCCARILDPDSSKLGGALPPVPGRESLRRALIKLDLFLMLCRRTFHSPEQPGFLVHRYLSSDASPQAHQNYFCTIEDILRQPVGFRASSAGTGFNPFTSGLEVERRSLPALTLGKGQASTAHKARLLLHCACLEYGQQHLRLFRQQVVAFLSDQGTERNLPQFPLNIDGDLADFITGLSAEAKAGSSADPFLFPQALSLPGVLHIMFNALEESLVQVEEWKQMERELQAASQIVGEPSSQALLLEKLYEGARPNEREAVHAFRAKLLNWRWQSLQEVVWQWIAVFPSLQERWDPSAFPDPTSKYVLTLSEAHQSQWHYFFLSWLCMFTSTVGKEATWFEGCFCHQDILAAHTTKWARKKAMAAAHCAHGSCPWQGRRLTGLALGHAKGLCHRVMNASHWQYTSALLASPQAEARRMAEIDLAVKTKFVRVIEQKFGPFVTLPYVLAGGFGEYCGYPLIQAKKAIAEAIAEYDTLAPQSRDAASAALLEHDPRVSQQLREFATDPERPLHDYPEAFLSIRARAFALCAERHTEGEHARVKFHAQRGFRFAGPVMVAARKRRLEVQRMIKMHLSWLAERWHAKNLFVTLLEHLLPKAEVAQMSWANKCQRVYACHPSLQFSDLSKWEKEAESFQKVLGKVQAALEDHAVKPTEEQLQMVYFIKHLLANGTFASVPSALWRAGTCPVPSVDAVQVSPVELESMLLSAKLPERQHLRDQIFFL